jgi:nicotinamidase-related amidase
VKLERSQTALVVVDVQEAFRPVVIEFDRVSHNVAVLIEGARILGVPVIATEQYPKGLGRTVPEVARQLDGIDPIEKLCFSAAGAEEFSKRLEASGRDQILLCGIESHVCVNQTAEDLLAGDHEVHVVQDAVSSRSDENRRLGLHKMEHAGAVITSVETALFELLGAAGTADFKEIQKLVK